VQRIRIGTTKDGRITAIGHESWSGDLPDGKADGAVAPTRMLYAGSNRMTATKLAVLDLPEGNAMRAPGETTGMMTPEIAIDEMAEKLGIDPIEFRILNDTQVRPRPSSARVFTESPGSCRRADGRATQSSVLPTTACEVLSGGRRALRLELTQPTARPNP
jgi:CO/xanthine dehydrogenase Mo-binding subunit